MPLSQQEIDWIANAVGAVPQIAAGIDIEARKSQMLKEARERIEGGVGTIHVGEDFDVETLSGFLKRKVTMSSIGEDPNEEFDTGHDTKKMTGMDGKDFAALMNAQSIIATEVETLRGARNEETRKPLFTDKEISEAIWQPLKRRKLIAENAIPDRYSEVSTTFEGASGEYEMRLAAYTDSLKGNEDTLKALGLTKDVIETAGAVAGAVLTDLGSLGKLANTYEAVTIAKGVTSVLTTTLSVSSTLVKDGGITKANCDALGKEIFKALSDTINAGFSGGSRDEYDLGKCIAYAVGAAASGPSIYAKVKAKKYGEIFDDIADLVIAGFNAADYGIKAEGESDTGPGGSGVMQYNEFGMAIGNALKTARLAVESLVLKDEPTAEDLLKIFQNALKGAIDTGSYVMYDKDKASIEGTARNDDGISKEDADTEANPDAPELKMAWGVNELEWQSMRDAGAKAPGLSAMDKLYKAAAQGPEALDKLMKEDPSCKHLQKMADIIKKQNDEIQKQALATFDEEMEASEQQFRDMLNRSESGDSEKDVEAIEALILEMKKDQMIVELSMQIASLPAQAVAAFIPQLGAVSSGIELVKNITKATLHFKAFAEWHENVRDAKSAMSVQVEAMTNRMDWSGKKGADEVLAGLENAAKLVGAAMSYAGPFAPAGHVVAATASGVTALRTIITKMVREAEMRDAWKIYKAARANPDDRKLVRESMRKNPTLSKYVIAWGAEVEGDPVAKAAMKKCGLTADVLSNRNSNVQKVVTFLETMYPDDPILLQPIDRPEKWYPGPVEFTAASFATFAGAAERDASPKMKKGAASGLLATFTRFDQYKDAVAAARLHWQQAAAAAQQSPPANGAAEAEREAEDDLRTATEAALRSAQMLMAALKSLKPVDEREAPHGGFVAYCGMLLPTARAFVAKFKREAEALAVLEDDEEK